MVRTSFQVVQQLSSPTYEHLDDIGRCLHFDDFEQAMERGYLVPQRLANSHKRLTKLVLWFAPCQPMSAHNYYGNVTFVVKWETVLQKLGPNLYLIDQAIYNSRSFTRVVLTKTNYDYQLDKVDLYADNSALTNSWGGYRHASSCFNKKRHGPHELQIAIEVDEDDARWLFENCKRVANNHSLSNDLFIGEMVRKGKYSKYESYKCFKFNTAQNKECPYEFTEEQCRERVLAKVRSGTANTRGSWSPGASTQVRINSPVRIGVFPLVSDDASLLVLPVRPKQISSQSSTPVRLDVQSQGKYTRDTAYVVTNTSLVGQKTSSKISFPFSNPNISVSTNSPQHCHSSEYYFEENNFYSYRSDSRAPESMVPAIRVLSGNNSASSTTKSGFHPSHFASQEARIPGSQKARIPASQKARIPASQKARIPVSSFSARPRTHTAITSPPGKSSGSYINSSLSTIDSQWQDEFLPRQAGRISQPSDKEPTSAFSRIFSQCLRFASLFFSGRSKHFLGKFSSIFQSLCIGVKLAAALSVILFLRKQFYSNTSDSHAAESSLPFCTLKITLPSFSFSGQNLAYRFPLS